MRLPRILISAMALGLGAIACAAPPVYPISTAEVARAVFAAHPDLAGSSVDTPASVSAHAPSPSFEAGAIEHWAGAGAVAHVRLRCAHPGDCLPFYAVVQSRQAHESSTQIASTAPAGEAVLPQAVHSGAHVFLLIDSGRLHLRLPVTALGSGATGSTVRVAGPTRGKVFEALVVDSTTVRGTL